MPSRAVYILRTIGIVFALTTAALSYFVIWKLYTGRGGDSPIRSALQEQPLVALLGLMAVSMGIGLAIWARAIVENRRWFNPLWVLRERRGELILFASGNSCRSQMAEGWARHLKGEKIEAYSAGIEAHGLNPRALQVMAEAGVDISDHRSQTLNDLGEVELDYVVTVCGHADERCPAFPDTTQVVHVGFDDPPKLAADATTDEEALPHYRRVCDEIKKFIQTLPGSLKQ